jgi:DNA-binding SARP family transcriptional activator/predicted ATPase
MSTTQFRFFGPGLIVDASGQPVAMRSRKQLALLVYLATEHANAHSRETLMALFWPEETTAGAQNNLRVTLSRLRTLAGKLVVDDAPPAELLITDRSSVQLHPAWIDRVDVNHFNHLLERTRQHAHRMRSQCPSCQAALTDAVQLYQDDFLAGFGLDGCPAVEEWLLMQRERLHLLVIEAYADLAAYAETNGDLSAARSFTQRQIEIDPLREPAYRQQMRILAKQGERSLALVTFERCRTVMREELGLDPESETLALHAQLLAGEIEGQSRPGSPAPGAVAAPRHNLPQQLTPFIGREQELAQLQARLANPTYRLMSIVGPGGIGKSRLAQQVAAQQIGAFADGVYFVSLTQAPSIESIPAAIAETIGLAFIASQKNPAEQLFKVIGSKQLLLVLDNFEHLTEGAGLLLDLLRRSPNVVLLVTSRERLNLQAEDLFELHGLPTPVDATGAAASTFAAVRLFVDRAHRLDKQFKLSAAQLPQVVRICQLVEGFPLAIELAATWLGDLTCQEIVAELTTGLDRLETTLGDVDPQHRSLRAVFNSSWRLLSAAERQTLAQLAIFRGGFHIDAARIVANAYPSSLSSLRNKSLLRSSGSRRYDMHALVHQFAGEFLAADRPAQMKVRLAHAQYFLTLMETQAIDLDTRNARLAGDRIQPDWENIALAWQWAVEHGKLDLLHNALDGIVHFCDLRGLFQEAQMLLERSIADLETSLAAAQQTLCCRLLTALAYFTGRRGLESTFALAQRALALAYALDSKAEIVSNLVIQASVCELSADFAQGIALAEQALALAQAEQLDRHVGLCLDQLGNIALFSGDYDRANQMFQQVLSIHETTGRLEQRGRAAIGYLGLVATEQGRYDLGLEYNQRYFESCAAMDDRHNIAHAQHFLAYLWVRLGHFEQAIALDTQSAARAALIGDQDLRSYALHTKAWAHRHLGQLAEALLCASEAVALARKYDAPLALGLGLGQLAEAQMALLENRGAPVSKCPTGAQEAAANFQEAATILREIGKLTVAYDAEIGLAELMRRRGQIDTALRQITPILPYLPIQAAPSWDEPIRAYVVCVQILRAAHDARAERLLEQGLQLLACLAQNIGDRTLREHFLNAIPAHRQLRAL